MAITNYWSDNTVESAKKERERLKKNYARGSQPRRANNLDDDLSNVPSYEEHEEHEESEMDDDD